MLPLWRDASGTTANVAPGLLDELSSRFGFDVTANDLLAYVACLTSHGGYTTRFHEDLSDPGVRVPLTADGALFLECARLGSRIVWLYTYGERFVDAGDLRPPGPPRVSGPEAPKVRSPIPDDEDLMPIEATYEAATQTLRLGEGSISPVPLAVWEFNVSGYEVVQRWIKKRVKNPEGNRSSALDEMSAERWTAATTTELLDLLNVVGLLLDLSPRQAELLELVLQHPLITVNELEATGIFPPPAAARTPPTGPKPASPQLPL